MFSCLCCSVYSFFRIRGAAASLRQHMIQAALLVFNDMDGQTWYTPTKQLKKTPLKVCEDVRRLPRHHVLDADERGHIRTQYHA